jgi:spermidine synthase
MTKAFIDTFVYSKISSNKKKSNKNFFIENLTQGTWEQILKISNLIFETESKFQKISIFENSIFGKVLTLDGIIQTTENDEFIYHEMLSHIPILSHGEVKKVLIIGGGDGGMLREVLRHKKIKKVTMVEIDKVVVDACAKYIPKLSNRAYEDPRAQIIIGDGIEFVKNTKEIFDIIIVDSTDPLGPGMVLFTKEFYSYCKNALDINGIIVTQNGVPFVQENELTETYKNRLQLFKDNRFYLAPVFTYIGGFMTFGWATDNKNHFNVKEEKLTADLKKIDGKMKYYTPQIHKASFVLPKYIQDKLK